MGSRFSRKILSDRNLENGDAVVLLRDGGYWIGTVSSRVSDSADVGAGSSKPWKRELESVESFRDSKRPASISLHGPTTCYFGYSGLILLRTAARRNASAPSA